MDFVMAHSTYPCKHIYRLAIELGLFEKPPTKDPQAAEKFDETIPSEIERFLALYKSGAISAEKFAAIAKALRK